MSNNLKLFCLLFIFIIMILILSNIKNKRIDIKYSVVWIVLFGLLFIFLIIPGFLERITKLLGFQISSNMIFSILIGILVIINIAFTIIISAQNKKIRNIIQELSILKSKENNNK